jgi:hypothetical protein
MGENAINLGPPAIAEVCSPVALFHQSLCEEARNNPSAFRLVSHDPFGLNGPMILGPHWKSLLTTIRCRAMPVLASCVAWTFIASCGSSTSSSDGGGSVRGNVVIKDQNNYTATSNLAPPHVATKPGADLKVCWDAIDKDLLCHDVNVSTDINDVRFLAFADLSASDIEKKLSQGLSISSYVERFYDYYPEDNPGKTCVQLSSMKSSTDVALDPAKDYVVSSTSTYMLLFAHGTTLSSQARSMVFIDPTDGASTTDVNAVTGCGILDFKADITTPSPVEIPASGPWVVDWSSLTKDGLGQPVIFPNIDQLLLGYYEGMSVADVQKRFVDIQTMATSMYEISIPEGKKYVDLKTATSSQDGAFSGFGKRDGTWAIALMCTTCQVPAPIALVVLNLT